MEQTETHVGMYTIGGRRFTVSPVVARQEKWLWPLIKPMFAKGESITADDIFSLMTESITRIAAILLIPEGSTQAQKARAGIEGVEQLERWLDESVSVSELGPVVADFFASGQQWKMLTGLAGPLRLQTTGSTRPSASSPTEILSEPSGSGSTSDSVTADGLSNAPSNETRSSEPFLLSVE